MNPFVNAQCRWLTATVTGIIVAAPTAIYNGLGNQIQKVAVNTVWDQGTEAVKCVAQHKDNASNKLFKELEEKTSVVWSNINYDVRMHMLTRVPALNISTKDPSKNMAIIDGWIREAALCNLLKFECDKERIDCNQKLPSALVDSLDAERKINAERTRSEEKIAEKQKILDPLLERKGECKELENLKAEVERLKKIEIAYEVLKAKTEQKSIFNW